MPTLLCRIEACLNSQSIAPVSNNLDDYHTLIPSHFLIRTSLIAPAKSSILNLNKHRFSRWQMIQYSTEDFWKAWTHDYLYSLQQRPKWRVVQHRPNCPRPQLFSSSEPIESQSYHDVSSRGGWFDSRRY